MRLVQCEDHAAWDAFVDASPQGSVFCRSAFLLALGVAFDLWWVEGLDGQPELGTVVLLDQEGRPLRTPYSFSMYHGPMLADGLEGLPLHRGVPRALLLMEFLLAARGRNRRTADSTVVCG